MLRGPTLPDGAPIEVVVDDTLFCRWGPRVFGAFWSRDGSAQDPHAFGRGNRWVIVGIVVELGFCAHPVCLPVLFRLWAGKGTASPSAAGSRTDLIGGWSRSFPTVAWTPWGTPPTMASRC